jgi:hypothetical protein
VVTDTYCGTLQRLGCIISVNVSSCGNCKSGYTGADGPSLTTCTVATSTTTVTQNATSVNMTLSYNCNTAKSDANFQSNFKQVTKTAPFCG